MTIARASGPPSASLQQFPELGSVKIDRATYPVLLRSGVVRRPGRPCDARHRAFQIGNH